MKKYIFPVILVLLAIAGVFYLVRLDKAKNSESILLMENPAADCQFDQQVCQYFVKQAEVMSKGVVIDSRVNNLSGQENMNSQMKIDGQGNMQIDSYQNGKLLSSMITLDQVTYIKAADQNTWYKLDNELSPTPGEAESDQSGLADLEASYSNPDDLEISKVGTESCGNLTCDKYQLKYKNESESETAQIEHSYIWIDQKEQLARQMEIATADSLIFMTYSYQAVTIVTPSPVAEMPSFGAGQSPDQDSQMPSQEEIEQMMREYGAE